MLQETVNTSVLRITVIITTRNRPQMLVETVTSLLASNHQPCELIIIDQSDVPLNAPSFGSVNTDCQIRYVHTSSRGLSRARNQGIALASTDILVFTDDDMYVHEDWLGTIVRTQLDEGPDAVITGRVLSTSAPGCFVPAVVISEEPETYSGRIDRDVLASGNMSAYKSTLTRIGGYDEKLGAGSRFPAAEDNDLGYQLLESGIRIRYVPEAILYHRAWRKKSMYPLMRWRYGRGKGGFYAKHSSLSDPHILKRCIRDLTTRLLAFPVRLVRTPRRACGDLIYSAGVLAGYLEWAASVRRRSG